MKKALQRWLTALLALAAAAALAFGLAAVSGCNKDDGPAVYTITYVLYDDNSTTTTAKAGEAITPPQDPTRTGYMFEGWYLTAEGGEKQQLPTVMPEQNVTYYAHWTPAAAISLELGGGTLEAGQTLYLTAGSNLYEFMQDYLPQKGGCQFGEWLLNGAPLAADAVMPAEGVTLTAHYKLQYTVNVYKFDILSDSFGQTPSSTRTEYAYAGTQISGIDFVPQDFEIDSSTQPITIAEGAQNVLNLYVNPQALLYTDILGGSDYIYELLSEPGALYLSRMGMDMVKIESYNADTGIFSQTTKGGEFTLEGKITGDYFYYFRSTFGGTYAAYDGSSATIQITSKNNAVYTPAAGEAQNGVFDIDPDTGRYIFTSDGGQTLEFVFAEKDDELVFRTKGTEDGFYAYKNAAGTLGYILLELDGFGLVTEYWNPLDPYEDTVTGLTYNQFIGDYTIDGDMLTVSISYPNEDDSYTVKMVNEAGVFLSYALKGHFLYADGLEGDYDSPALVLDGYGNGTYNGVAGTYSVAYPDNWPVYTETGDLQVYYGDAVVTFKPTAGDTVRFAVNIEESYITFYHAVLLDGTQTHGKYTLSKPLFYNGMVYESGDNSDVFLYIDGSGYAYVWYGTPAYDSQTGDPLTDTAGKQIFGYDLILSGMLYGDSIIDDITNDSIYFTLENGTVAFDGFEAFTLADGEDGKLTLDPDGNMYYTPKGGERTTVEYRIDSGVAHVYTVTMPDGTSRYFMPEEGEDGAEFLEVTANVYMEEYLTPEAATYQAVIIITDQNLTHTANAILGMAMRDGSVSYMFMGSLRAGDGEDMYNFNIEVANSLIKPSYGYQALFDDYGEFALKLNDDNTFNRYTGALNLTSTTFGTFTADGYGGATLVLTYTGFNIPAGTYNGYYNYLYGCLFFSFTYQSNEVLLQVLVQNNNTFSLPLSTGEEIGSYIGIQITDAGYYIYEVFLNGCGNAAIYRDGLLYGNATYTATGKTGLIGPEFALNGTSGEGPFEWYIVTYTDDEYGGTYFAMRNPAWLVEGVTVDLGGGQYGYLECAGYDYDAIFADADDEEHKGYLSRGFMEDGEYIGDTDTYARQFLEDENGDAYFFRELDEEGYVIAEYVFDILEDGTVLLRTDNYGAYGEYENGAYTGNYLYLDGHGKAVLYNEAKTEIANGEYTPAGDGDYLFNSATEGVQDFTFALIRVQNAAGTSTAYRFCKQTGDGELTVVNGDWSVLYLDGFVTCIYVNEYGDAVSGEYAWLTDTLVRVQIRLSGSVTYVFYELDEDYTSFTVLTGEFLYSSDGILWVYQGVGGVVNIPDEVTRITTTAFHQMADYITEINFNNVEIIDDEAFYYGGNFSAVRGEKIKKIGARAFVGNNDIDELYLPAIEEIGDNAFEATYIQKAVLGENLKKIGAHAFSWNPALADGGLTLDLTAVASFDGVEIDATAFNAKRAEEFRDDEYVEISILVKDVSVLNALYKSWDEGVKDLLFVGGEQSVEGLYFGLTDGTRYLLDGARILQLSFNKEEYGSQYYSATLLTRYYADGENNLHLYALDGGEYKEGASLPAGDIITYGGKPLFKSGAAHTLKSGGDVLEITLDYTAEFDSFEGLYDVSPIEVVAKYNSAEVTAAYGEGGLTFTTQSGAMYSVAVTGAQSFTLQSLGETFFVEDKIPDGDDNDIWYKVEFLKDAQGKLTVLSLGTDNYGTGEEYDYDDTTVVSSVDKGGNVYEVTCKDSWDHLYIYVVKYTDGDVPSVEVSLTYSIGEYNDGDYVYKAQAKVEIKTGKIVELMQFGLYDGDWYTITGDPQISEDGMSVTVETEEAGKFEITLSSYGYGYQLSVKKAA